MMMNVPQIRLLALLILLLLPGCVPITPVSPLSNITTPVFRIETGMHLAAITSIDVDEQERFFVTASLDKTVRVWSVADGELLSTFRIPIGRDEEGKLYACAISPDGRLIAAGGFTGAVGSSKSIYILDRQSGRMLRRLSGLADVIYHLTFSADGSYLAASMGGNSGLQVWDTGSWASRFQDSSYQGSSHWVDFDRSGSRMVTASDDGLVRLYGKNPGGNGFHLLTSIRSPGGKKPFAAVFSPDGQSIAVGFNDTINIDVVSATDLLRLYSPDTDKILKGRPYVPDTSNTMDGYLGTICWSKDGRTLYAGSIFNKEQIVPISSWADQGRGRYRAVNVQASNSIVGLKPLTNGLLFATYQPSFGVIDRNNRLRIVREPMGMDPRKNLRNFLVSNDGSAVQVALGLNGEHPMQFSLENQLLTPAAGKGTAGKMTAPRLTSSAFGVSGWEANRTPKRNGEFIRLDPDEVSQSLAIHPRDIGFVLGTSKYIRAYDSRAQLRWQQKSATGWAVNISGNGRMVIAALADGTIRWYNWQDGREVAALFVSRDGSRWVVWTPDGYFDHAPGGEQLIGYQLNQGEDALARFISVDQMYDYFYRPDVILARFFGRDYTPGQQENPIPVLVADDQLAAVNSVVRMGLPPDVSVMAEEQETSADQSVVNVKFADNGGGIGRVVYRVNGATLAEEVPEPIEVAQGRGLQVSKTLPLASGENVIEITAYNRSNQIESRPVRVRVNRKPVEPPKPNLYIVAIGISKYRDHALELNYPVDDARGLAEALEAHGKGLYDDVIVRYVLDKDATRENIQKVFSEVSTEMSPDDVFVLYVAGHGLNVDGNYFFFPWELVYTGNDSVKKEAMSRVELQKLLAGVPSQKAVVLLDTCDAGAFSGANMRGLVAKTAIYKLVRATGRATIMASSDSQAALEGYKGHGVFTWALIDAIKGAADKNGNRNNQTSINEIAEQVMDEVPRITMKQWQYEQFPMQNLSGNSFPLGVVQ
jgi:WD40 repeat protein